MVTGDETDRTGMAGTTALFTDIVGSTELALRLGDAAWADLLERHNQAVRGELVRFGGVEMDTSGDGFFAVFPEPAAAIEAAYAIAEALRPLGLSVRIGIHNGDCFVVEGKCTGIAMHIAARLVALAGPGEVLASEAVHAAASRDFDFEPRGSHELKGLPGEWPVYAVKPVG